MEIKHKHFKLTTFGKSLVFLSFFFVVLIIPVVVDAYGKIDIFCFSSDDCYNEATGCPGRSICRDNRPGYDSYCRKTADDCMSVREKGPVSCNNKKITICDYKPIATETPSVPTCTLSANPTSVASGDSSTLKWSSTNATKCSATWTSSTATSGTKSVSPSTTTTYNMTCTGAGGSGSCSAKVIVPVPPTTPTCTLSANPTSVASGDSSTLKWSSTNATKCSATWTSSTATSGTKSVSPSTTTTYNMTCTGAGGSVSCSAKVTVTTATHKECNNNYTGCISVAGSGADQCTNDASCTGGCDSSKNNSSGSNDVCIARGGPICCVNDKCVKCGGTPTPTSTPTSSPVPHGTSKIKATFDGNVWSGNVNYTLTGRETVTGTTVPKDFSVLVGSYTVSVTSGGPNNAILDGVSPAASLTILAGQTTTFTLNFKTIIGASHKACNVSNQCITLVGAGADTCTDDVSCGNGPTPTPTSTSIPSHKVCNASDQCVSVAGSGPDQCINDTSCTLPPIGFVCNFSWSPESPKAKSAVNFFDYTQTPEGTTLISWDWIFESGTPTTSSDQSPGAVIFNSAGEKTVTLSATNSDNEVCTLNQEITVQSLNPKWIEVLPK